MSGVELILKACAFAAKAHLHHRRRYHNAPYINHLLRVCENATLAKLSDEAVAAAVLHDVLEDTETTKIDLQEHFPERVVELVLLLTKWWPDRSQGLEVTQYKSQYYQAIALDSEATVLKLLDRADNLSDFIYSLPDSHEEASWYLDLTRKEFPKLVEACKNDFAKSQYLKALLWLENALKKTNAE